MKILLKFGEYCDSLEVLLSEIGLSHSTTVVLNNKKSTWIDHLSLKKRSTGLSYIGGINRHYSLFIPRVLVDLCSILIGREFLSLVEEYHRDDYRSKEKLLRLRTLYSYFYWCIFLYRKRFQLVLIKGGTRLNDRMLLELVKRNNVDFYIVERGPFFGTFSLSQGLGPKTYVCSNSIVSKNRDTSWVLNMLLKDELNTPWAKSSRKNTLELDEILELLNYMKII